MLSYRFGSSIYNHPVEECIEYALTHNLRHFEINVTPWHSHPKTFSASRISNLRAIAQKHGFSFSFHLPSSLNISHHITYFRQRHIRQVARFLQIGAQLGITHLTLHLGTVTGHTSMHYFRSRALQNAVSSLISLIQLCEIHQIPVAVENSARLHHGSDIEMLGDNVNDFKVIFDRIASPWLCFCLDIGHANMNEGALPYIKLFRKRIKCVHFHDNNGIEDEHLQIGGGTVKWKDTINALRQINFSGPFISECFRIESHIAASLFSQYWNGKK